MNVLLLAAVLTARKSLLQIVKDLISIFRENLLNLCLIDGIKATRLLIRAMSVALQQLNLCSMCYRSPCRVSKKVLELSKQPCTWG